MHMKIQELEVCSAWKKVLER